MHAPPSNKHVLVLLALASGCISGCELFADFDRDLIPVPDAAVDAPNDSPGDAAEDAADAGEVDGAPATMDATDAIDAETD